ncbi:glyoxalase [Terrabacter lapilli]|uniref:Glyoxalase n=1 Tax=Terrabacter lapilli TaxID=436231 RepID=A0ABN2RM14_9MICO
MTTLPDTVTTNTRTTVDAANPADPADLATVRLRLEAVVVPVADYDRAKAFYTGLGWRVDADVDDQAGYRLMQLTPPGSQASVIFGTRVTAAPAGAIDGLLLVVDDIEEARAALRSRGVQVSDAFHDAGGGLAGGFHPGLEGQAPGPDPERRSYATYASFQDSEGNRWVLQEITTRLPGRLWETDASGSGSEHLEEDEAAPTSDVDRLAELLHETAQHHDTFEKAAPEHDWWNWYAPYLHARQHGLTGAQAQRRADQHMAEQHGVVADRH